MSPVYLADVTLTSKRLLRNFDLQCGLRNAFNRRYHDPIALNPVVDSMQQPGRSFFVDDAATLLGVSRRTVYYLIRDGKLRTIRTMCGSQRVLLESIDELLSPKLL